MPPFDRTPPMPPFDRTCAGDPGRDSALAFARAVRALLPRDLADYADRRGEFLAPDAFPLAPLDAPGMPPAGPDFEDYAASLCGGPPAFVPLKGLRGPAKAEAQAANDAAAAEFAPRRRAALEYAYMRALYEPGAVLPVVVKGRASEAVYVSGGTRGEAAAYGPVHWSRSASPRVMVVGKCVGYEEERLLAPFVGPSSAELDRALRACGLSEEDVASWYFTNVVKHRPLDPASDTLARAWAKNGAPLLAIEQAVFRPDFVLCLGAHAVRGVLDPGATVAKLAGRVVPRVVDLGVPAAPCRVAFRATAAIHPAHAARRPEYFPDLVDGVGAFAGLVAGRREDDVERGLRHVCLYTERRLAAAVDEVIAAAAPGVGQAIAVDCEWNGDRPGESNAYLRTVQFSHRAKTAFCVVLRHAGGRPAFKGGEAAVRRQLLRLLKSTPGREVRVGGHYLRADLPWLLALGVDCRDEYAAAASPGAAKDHGGWDTATLAHAYMEAIEGGYKLESLAARFCGVPRYDLPLQAWKKAYTKARKLKDRELEGYGNAPDEVLHPYAAYDSDSTIRLFERLNGRPGEDGLLDRDGFGQSCREGAWMRHRAALAALEMEMAGIPVDRGRGDRLTAAFAAAADARAEEFRRLIGWDVPPGDPEWPGGNRFNAQSVDHVRELLYGVRLNGKRGEDGGPRRLRPRGAPTLKLTPVKAAGDKKVTWDRVVAEGAQAVYNPATDKETLGILSHVRQAVRVPGRDAPAEKGEVVARLRDIKFLQQVLKGNLRRPFAVKGEVLVDDDGYDYDGGLLYYVNEDGRVRTHFGLVETGRWSSWLPNLQNISKRREEDYQRILGVSDPTSKFYCDDALYLFPIRSILRASPGHVLVEADYKMAELAMIGFLAQDPAMLEMVRRNTLPESDPDYADPHSSMAIEAFRLDTAENRARLDAYNRAKGTAIAWGATKDVLKAIDASALRVAAKNVIFGVPYGRSAAAIARQCREEGADVSEEEAQRLIARYHAKYPRISAYLAECQARVTDVGWMKDTFGALRRFYPTPDRTILAEMQRQACNFGIQAGVAQCINVACENLVAYRRDHRAAGGTRDFRMCLQIHDALLFEVPAADAAWLIDEVIPTCMTTRVDIWPRDLDGNPLPGVTTPYHLDTDRELFIYWGEKIGRAAGLELGLPEVTPGGHRLLPREKKPG